MIDLIIAKYTLTKTQIIEYIDKRYKSEKYRNILKERIIDGRKLEYLAIKYYGEDNSQYKIWLLEKKISKMTHNFYLWLDKERNVKCCCETILMQDHPTEKGGVQE